ncbi:MAG: hypothetical protein RIF32_19795 [Leptospirales bacterium]|jgi:hypothetical protein
MNSKQIIGIAAVALVLLAVVYFLLADGGTGGPLGPDGEIGRGDEIIGRGGDEGFLSPRELERLVSEGPSPKAMLEAYRLYSRYPPNSRPLDQDMKDLTEPWQIRNIPLPILPDPRMRTEAALKQMLEELVASGKSREEAIAELEKRGEGAPRFVFELNKHTITADDKLVAKLSVTDADGVAVPAEILGAQLEGDESLGKPGLGSVEYSQIGAGGYQFTWSAPGPNKKYWGSLTLKVRARVPGIDGETELVQSFYSSPIVPARFTGQFSERLDNGSLYIDATVDVQRECQYNLHANLYSLQEDEPTHWVAADAVLQPGRQIVTFEFFGKIFRDNGYSGKFELRDLRGTCENLPFPASWLGDPTKIKAIETVEPKNEPLLLYVPYTDATFTTRSYALDEFSDAEWNSDVKEKRLQRLRELAGEG